MTNDNDLEVDYFPVMWNDATTFIWQSVFNSFTETICPKLGAKLMPKKLCSKRLTPSCRILLKTGFAYNLTTINSVTPS